MVILVLGLAVLVAVLVGVAVVLRMARAEQMDRAPPKSSPSDFVAPSSSGGYLFRKDNETAEDFRQRVSADAESQSGRSGDGSP